MDLFLIRHAHAGTRTESDHDKYRPLSDQGRVRARELPGLLAVCTITRVVSSPASRCVQTVAPLAAKLGLEVEEMDELWEGALVTDTLAALEPLVGLGVAACSHGDIIPELIDGLGARGLPIRGHGCEKGSIWVLHHDGRDWTGATKVPQHAASWPLPKQSIAGS